ncbi:MAG: hypothetical protein R3C09_20375 [Pirellulaceae bacterium]
MLVIDDGLEQIEVAQMLGRHKSWVNRRLALIERLCSEARESLRLGLIIRRKLGIQNPAVASGNQNWPCKQPPMRPDCENSGVVDLLLASSTQQQTQFVLENLDRLLRNH